MRTILGYSQDDILTASVTLAVAVHSFSRAVTIALICFSALPTSAAESDKALALRRNVVTVSSAGTDENGFGFIASERDGKLYIVTADHVVAGTPDSPSPSISVVFFTDQGKSYKANVIKRKKDHDLALLEVEAPPGLRWDKQCLAPAEEEKRGTPVWFVGRDGAWYVPVLNGAISSEKPNADLWLLADMPGLRPGSSGGPLVTETGILGMVKASSADDTRVLSVEYIKNAVQDWGYAWDLTTSAVSKITTHPNIIHFQRTFQFRQPVFNIAPSPLLKYGFTSLEHDGSLTGKIQITKITIVVRTKNNSDNVFGDLWAFLGPKAIRGQQSHRTFPAGSATWSDIDTYPWDLLSDAPAQVKLTFGRSEPVTASYTYTVTYDFATHTATVEPPMECTTKSYMDEPMYLEDGLYVQLFIWTGAPRVNIDIGETKIDVEGVYVDIAPD